MTRMISKSVSTAIVNRLMEQDAAIKKFGFRKAVHEILPDAPADFLPDAYAIWYDERRIDLIEIVDTNPIMRPKASLISALWEHASLRGWSVVVVGYDSCGGLMFEMTAQAFYPAFVDKYMAGSMGNSIPAAMAVERDLAVGR